ncbi:MAG TPA: lysophospholipid acyltransferase family protein, partial [Planctomycetota bacterium]|nr:lysophospholipid acyltransferase family protein [Planctomycetota bacterium]
MIRGGLLAVLEALFRVLFTYDCLGEEKLPATGGAIISANHPSYLDPILLSLQVKRPILFMAWDRLFRVPLLGRLLRLFGAFPVDVRPGRGLDAYARAKQHVLDGDLVGIFPEGKRSRAGWMEPELRGGAARLALDTGALVYPATIRGAFRAWPYFRALPEPAKIQVRYHDPIDPTAYASLPREEATEALLAELRRRVDVTLLPGVKADRKIDELYRTSAPWPRLAEALPALALALFVFWKTRSFALVWPCYGYIGYLLLDLLLVPQRRITKWI